MKGMDLGAILYFYFIFLGGGWDDGQSVRGGCFFCR